MPIAILAAVASRPRLRRAIVALALPAAFAPAALSAQRASYSSVTFFGDSYVDTGNALILTNGANPAPPYAPGRFSNGLVLTDYIAQGLNRPGDAAPAFATGLIPGGSFGASGNYAVGGARTDSPQVGTASQIGAYLTRAGATPTTRTDPNGLYVLFVGGNDLRDIAATNTTPDLRNAQAAAAAQRVITQASQLGAAGARNILLFTLPSLAATPEAQAIPGRPAISDAVTATFNNALLAGIGGLQSGLPGTSILNFRLDNLWTNILLDARSGGQMYGLTNLTVPCLPGLPLSVPNPPPCASAVFADAIHPTTRVHQLIGQSVVTYVTTGQNVAVIPEPSTVLLFGVGAATLAGAAYRRRRDRAA